jgi:hypothetical protein
MRRASSVERRHAPVHAEWAASLTGDAEWPIGEQLDGHFGIIWRYTGSRDQQFPGAPFFVHLGSYSTVNANLGVTRGPIRLNLFVKNL